LGESYTYFRPTALLSTYVDCIYRIKEGDGLELPKQHLSCPDGFGEIIFNLGGLYWREDLITGKMTPVPNGACIVVGQKLRPSKIHQEGRCDIISLKLKPFGLYFLSKTVQSNIIDGISQAEDVLGDGICDLVDRIKAADRDEQRIEFIQTFFEGRIPWREDRCIMDIISWISDMKGLVKIKNIADRFALTNRTLENRFKKQIGLSPKEFCSIVQLNNFVIAASKSIRSFTDTALECGFYDSSHLNRKFRSLLCSSPRKYFETSNRIHQINTDVLRKQLGAG